MKDEDQIGLDGVFVNTLYRHNSRGRFSDSRFNVSFFWFLRLGARCVKEVKGWVQRKGTVEKARERGMGNGIKISYKLFITE